MANISFPPKMYQERVPDKDNYYDVLASNLADYCAALALDEPVKSAKVDIFEQGFAKAPILQHDNPWPLLTAEKKEVGFVGKATGTGVFLPCPVSKFAKSQRHKKKGGKNVKIAWKKKEASQTIFEAKLAPKRTQVISNGGSLGLKKNN